MNFHHKKGENIELCACRYEAKDPNMVDYLGVLMITMMTLVEVGGAIFSSLIKYKI